MSLLSPRSERGVLVPLATDRAYEPHHCDYALGRSRLPPAILSKTPSQASSCTRIASLGPRRAPNGTRSLAFSMVFSRFSARLSVPRCCISELRRLGIMVLAGINRAQQPHTHAYEGQHPGE